MKLELEDLLEVIEPKTELMLLNSNGKEIFNHTVLAKSLSAAIVGIYAWVKTYKVLCVAVVCTGSGFTYLEITLDDEN